MLIRNLDISGSFGIFFLLLFLVLFVLFNVVELVVFPVVRFLFVVVCDGCSCLGRCLLVTGVFVVVKNLVICCCSVFLVLMFIGCCFVF